jgi:hypothetical protein
MEQTRLSLGVQTNNFWRLTYPTARNLLRINMEILKSLIEYGSWPVVVLVLGLVYKKVFWEIIPKKDVIVTLPGGLVFKLTTKEAEERLRDLPKNKLPIFQL